MKASNRKEDRRTQYTKMVLRQSLLALLKEKPINKITVTELCEKADVNRGTFYLHYYDAYDLLEKVENELYDSIRQTIDSALYTSDLFGFLEEIATSIAANHDLCQVLFAKMGTPSVLRRILDLIRDQKIREWTESTYQISPEYVEYAYAFMTNGCVAIIQNWVLNGFIETPRQIAALIQNLNDYGMSAFVKQKPQLLKN